MTQEYTKVYKNDFKNHERATKYTKMLNKYTKVLNIHANAKNAGGGPPAASGRRLVATKFTYICMKYVSFNIHMHQIHKVI